MLVARDVDGDVLSVSGRHAAAWTAEYPHNERAPTDASILTLPSGVYRVVTIPVMLQQDEVGSVQLAQALDDRYATELSTSSGARILVVAGAHIRATTLPADTVATITPELLRTFSAGDPTTINGEEYPVRPLLHEGSAAVYVLDSIDGSARPLIASSLQRMGVIALGAFALAAAASLAGPHCRTSHRHAVRLAH